MPGENSSTPSEPDPAILAEIAALPRFTGITSEAAAVAALRLWKDCQEEIRLDEKRVREFESARARLEEVPKPKQWPATLDDFYRSVVHGRDKTENQPRFKRFLRWQVEQEQPSIKALIDRIREEWVAPEGAIFLLEERVLRTSEAIDAEVEKRFALYKGCRFEPEVLPWVADKWTLLGRDYLAWWSTEKTNAKVRAGRARAMAGKLKKKVTEQQASGNLASAILGPEKAASAAKAKKRADRLRKKHSTP